MGGILEPIACLWTHSLSKNVKNKNQQKKSINQALSSSTISKIKFTFNINLNQKIFDIRSNLNKRAVLVCVVVDTNSGRMNSFNEWFKLRINVRLVNNLHLVYRKRASSLLHSESKVFVFRDEKTGLNCRNQSLLIKAWKPNNWWCWKLFFSALFPVVYAKYRKVFSWKQR